jgi:predicted rRNA methylase YqxC with S4 and FtsJ domains
VPIKALSETLVDIGWCDSQRQAVSKIKKGLVYVETIRVANPDALLVITSRTKLTMEDNECHLIPSHP